VAYLALGTLVGLPEASHLASRLAARLRRRPG
jgi:hypothetical protein